MIFISNNVDFGHAKNENENEMKLKFFREPDFDGECQSSFFCQANRNIAMLMYHSGLLAILGGFTELALKSLNCYSRFIYNPKKC